MNGKLLKGPIDLPTEYGVFKLYGVTEIEKNLQHVVMILGDELTEKPILIRIQSACLFG